MPEPQICLFTKQHKRHLLACKTSIPVFANDMSCRKDIKDISLGKAGSSVAVNIDLTSIAD